MRFIRQKPMSVNVAWQGRRFKTPLYETFAEKVGLLLRAIRPPKPDPDTPMFAHYIWGQSNMQADVDNPCKPFQDVLFDAWEMKSKDHRVQFMILEKHKTEKGKEFIGFHVDSDERLIEYLEGLITRLKKESEDVQRV